MDGALDEPPTADRHAIELDQKSVSLSPLDLEIIALLVAGYDDVESAVKIGISEHTVRRHLRHICVSLGVVNRVELVLFAASYQLSHSSKSPFRHVLS